MISQIVLSMLSMPPRDSNVSSDGSPLSYLKPDARACQTPFSICTAWGRSGSPASRATSAGLQQYGRHAARQGAQRDRDIGGQRRTIEQAEHDQGTGTNAHGVTSNRGRRSPPEVALASKSPGLTEQAEADQGQDQCRRRRSRANKRMCSNKFRSG